MTRKHDFTGKSIKCDTWEQMLHLAKLAEEQKAEPNNFKVSDFLNGAVFFEIYDRHQYTNLFSRSSINVKEIPYYNFIIPTDVVEVTGCGDCKLSSWNHSRTGVYCALQYTDEMSPNKLFTTCPLKKASLTIKLKQNDTTGN